ncbi:MAG: hypothetical protein AVDCRST_MAG88-3360, partial [uncultured Thermomicrobiales bacterium]
IRPGRKSTAGSASTQSARRYRSATRCGRNLPPRPGSSAVVD